ncbi:hypothetical protein ACNKHV_09370 [Shigella flexneri]
MELARKLLLQVNELGVRTATEFLEMVTGQFIAHLISWGAIGARTTESQIHREMASALSRPVLPRMVPMATRGLPWMLSAQPAPAICSSRQQKWSDDHLSDKRQPVWPHYYAWRQNPIIMPMISPQLAQTLHEFDLPIPWWWTSATVNCPKQHLLAS